MPGAITRARRVSLLDAWILRDLRELIDGDAAYQGPATISSRSDAETNRILVQGTTEPQWILNNRRAHEPHLDQRADAA